MKDNNLIPVNVCYDGQIQKWKKRGRFRHLIKRFLAFVIILSVFALIILNINSIKGFFGKIIPQHNEGTSNSVQNEDSTSTNTNTNVSTSTNQPQSNLIPNGAYEIHEQVFVFSQITNETELEPEPIEYDFKSASEIYTSYGNEAPVVLIIHSACLEAYSNGKFYDSNSEFYSNKNNVKEIGSIVVKKLNELKINTIHINDVFANGAIHSSREEYESAIKTALEKYPSIEYIFDISRDVLINDDLSMTKPVCERNGNKMAQLKITVGTNEGNDAWKSNLSFATMLASKNSSLVSSVVLSSFSLSQHLCPVSLKIDVGAFSNSFDEASLLANELSICLADLISE